MFPYGVAPPVRNVRPEGPLILDIYAPASRRDATRIARHFSAGDYGTGFASPVGTTDFQPSLTGLKLSFNAGHGTEVPCYSQGVPNGTPLNIMDSRFVLGSPLFIAKRLSNCKSLRIPVSADKSV